MAGLDAGTASAIFNAPVVPSAAATAPPTNILASPGEGDRGRPVFLAAVAFLSMAAWLLRRDAIKRG
jgi:hypothetical protein